MVGQRSISVFSELLTTLDSKDNTKVLQLSRIRKGTWIKTDWISDPPADPCFSLCSCHRDMLRQSDRGRYRKADKGMDFLVA